MSPNTSPKPSSSSLINPSPNSAPTSNNQDNVLNDKEAFIKFLRCALDNSKSENDKLAINGLIQAINLIPDIAWANAKGAYTSYYTIFQKYCNSNSSNSSSNNNNNNTSVKEVDLVDNVSEGIKKLSCSEEGKIKSSTGKSINLEFVNNTDKRLGIYWLNSNGVRIPYNKSFNSKVVYKQPTYVTHPWLIADENGNCIQIYLPENESANKIEINSFSFKN
ncbi:MAG: hypothetical protein KatS3mg068_2008 [Candidatus Sericytochromatia bacterium]|nr:MAG: hypothetical protein KatS3mg068_2008 [Candidatus Sericytochromatia bacterium]